VNRTCRHFSDLPKFSKPEATIETLPTNAKVNTSCDSYLLTNIGKAIKFCQHPNFYLTCPVTCESAKKECFLFIFLSSLNFSNLFHVFLLLLLQELNTLRPDVIRALWNVKYSVYCITQARYFTKAINMVMFAHILMANVQVSHHI
jgi:hypothetical protein